MKIIFIADFFVENGINGGGELNNEVFCDLVAKSDHKLLKVESKRIDIDFLKNNSDCKFVIANFVFLKSETIEYISSNLDAIISFLWFLKFSLSIDILPQDKR